MSRAQKNRWVTEVHQAVRTVIGNGLKQQLAAPEELPLQIALLVARIAKNDKYACVRLSVSEDRLHQPDEKLAVTKRHG